MSSPAPSPNLTSATDAAAQQLLSEISSPSASAQLTTRLTNLETMMASLTILVKDMSAKVDTVLAKNEQESDKDRASREASTAAVDALRNKSALEFDSIKGHLAGMRQELDSLKDAAKVSPPSVVSTGASINDPFEQLSAVMPQPPVGHYNPPPPQQQQQVHNFQPPQQTRPAATTTYNTPASVPVPPPRAAPPAVKFDEKLIADTCQMGYTRERVIEGLGELYNAGRACNDINVLLDHLSRR